MYLLSTIVVSDATGSQTLYPEMLGESHEALKDWALDNYGVVYGEWAMTAMGLVRASRNNGTGYTNIYSISEIEVALAHGTAV